jgi:hypothetical protein
MGTIKARCVAQVVEHLPSKHEALSSNPSTTSPLKRFNVQVSIISA